MAMTADQLEQLLAAVRPAAGAAGGRRLSSFASGDGAEWRVWKDNFVIMSRINNWNEAAQRDLLRVHMEGDAKRHTQHIAVVDRPINDILEDYDRAFLPAASSKLARSQFKTAAQLPGETILQWSSRLRELFIRAYPDLAADVDTQIQLREAFAEGIRDPVVREYVQDRDEATLNGAVAAAQAKEANLLSFRSRQGDGVVGTSRKLNAIQGPGEAEDSKVFAMGNRPNECWTCGSETHYKADCPQHKLQKQQKRKESGKKFYKGKKSSGGKKAGNGFGKKTKTTMPRSLNQMGEGDGGSSECQGFSQATGGPDEAPWDFANLSLGEGN